ncbi:MAG TPA: hypothetical protein VFC78_10230 [Tepidisphaeraceae bacterium]|nr:hypothetical protein [Tepidisphaeraceae bacterium]
MPPADRIHFALGILDSRDQQLSNFDYKLRETTTNVTIAGGDRRFMVHDDYEVRRLAGTLWMRLIDYEYYNEEDDILAESVMNWDGKVARGIGYPPYLHTSYHQCRIDPTENDNFAYRSFNGILGLQVVVARRGYPIATMVRNAMARTGRAEAVAERWKGIDTLRLEVHEGCERWTFWLDPNRGYIIARFEYYCDIKPGVYNKKWDEILESRQIGGVWVPLKAIERRGVSGIPVETEIAYDVQTFTIGSVSASDVDITFPVGSQVVDTVQNISYFVLPNGKFKLKSLADPPAHVVHVAPKNPVVESVGASAVAKYKTEDLVLAKVDTSRPPKISIGRKIGAILSAIAVFALLAVFVWRYGRRRAHVKP